MFLSIVIPVYNAESTIERCIDSIWSQGLPADDYEVICVDDCSKDGSVAKLLEIGYIHPQLRVLRNKENLHAGGARNHGVREAKGEYILFIDADDYYHPGGLKKAYDYQKSNELDILMCDFARHHESSPNDKLVHNFPSKDIMTGREFLRVNTLPFAPWKYIFRRSIMVDNNVWFAEKVSCEDVDWSHELPFYASKMQYQPILLNHYVLADVSQTATEYTNFNTVYHRILAGKRVADLISLYKSTSEKKQIKTVAESTLKYGLLFLCVIPYSPNKKARIIKENISDKIDWSRFIRIIRNHPVMYGYLSTLTAPFFKTAITMRRKFKGR